MSSVRKDKMKKKKNQTQKQKENLLEKPILNFNKVVLFLLQKDHNLQKKCPALKACPC
jgi:hypothetical protein